MDWKEKRAARRPAKEEERAAEDKRLEARRAELAKRLTIWQATYVGGTRDDAGLIPGKNYGITIEPEGLRVFADGKPDTHEPTSRSGGRATTCRR